jgi:hypothetical protein
MKFGKILAFIYLCVPQCIRGMVTTLTPHNHFQQQQEVQMRANSMPCLLKQVTLVVAIQQFIGRVGQFFSPVHPISKKQPIYQQIHVARLFNAVKHGQLLVVQQLLKKVPINSRDGQGNTPFMWAVSGNDCVMMRMLLRYNTLDINAANDFGETALMWATGNANLDTLELLLREPALVTHKRDRAGHTAIDWACDVKGIHKKIVRLLFKRDQIVINHYYQEWWNAHMRKKATV